MAKAKAKAKAEEPKKKGEKGPGHPRTWTSEQRRDAFLKARKEDKADYRILKSDFRETLVPYGNIVLDEVLALGGIARRGRVTQVHGDEGAGKTTTMLWIAAQYQKATKEPIAIFEYEPAASDAYAYSLGVDPEMCFFEHPTNIQDAIKRHVELMMDRGVRFFVNDSIPFMRPKVSREDIDSGKAFKSNFGGHAKAMTNFYELLNPYLMEYDVALFMVNQTRDRIDDDADNASKWSYTNKVYNLPGGRMARFAPSVMLELLLESEVRPWEWGSKMPPEKEKWLLIQPRGTVGGNFPTANKVRIRSLKNKVTGKGFRQGNIYIRPNMALDENMSIRELACVYNLIQWDNPTWFIGKTADDAVTTYRSKTELIEDIVIKETPDTMRKLRELVKDAIAQDETQRFTTSATPEEMAVANEDVAADREAARRLGVASLEDNDELATSPAATATELAKLEIED